MSESFTSRRRDVLLDMEDVGEASISEQRPDSIGHIVELLSQVFDDLLVKVDERWQLHRFEKQIVITSNGDHAVPFWFKARLVSILALSVIIWPYLGMWFIVVMCRSYCTQCWRLQSQTHWHAFVAWSRFLVLQLMFFLAAVHQAVFCWRTLEMLSRCIQHGWKSAYTGFVSVAEAFEPSAVFFLMACTGVLELALLRLEQSATRQLRKELQEYDFPHFQDEVVSPNPTSTNQISRISNAVDDLKKVLDGLGSIFYCYENDCWMVSGQNSTDRIHMSFGKNLYLRLFNADVQEYQRTMHDDGLRLQIVIAGERLSHQLRCAFTAEYTWFFWVLISMAALNQACMPWFTRAVLNRQGFLPTFSWPATDQFMVISFMSVNAAAVIACTTYFAYARRRFNRLTSALALILYVTATNSSRTVLGGQLQHCLERIHVDACTYQQITGYDTSVDGLLPLLSIDPCDKFFKLLGQQLQLGGEKIDHRSIQNFSNLRKYMYAVVATERVRVQFFFANSAMASVVCLAGIVLEVIFRPFKDGRGEVPVTAVLCTGDFVFAVLFLLIIFQDAVKLNIVLGDATEFVLESWRENILMHRLHLLPGQRTEAQMEHKKTTASLDYICHFVKSRQSPIGFCGIPMTQAVLQGIRGSAGAALLTVAVTLLEKYGSLLLDLFNLRD